MAALAFARFPGLDAETARIVEELRQSLALIRTRNGQGSGLLWNRSGLLLTNHHVAQEDRALVELSDGRVFTAEVIARDPRNDLAALRIPAVNLTAAPLGDSRALRVGEIVIAVGNPFGVRGTATLGIVSASGAEEVLQADVQLAPGNSGGPLADTQGRVMGIASRIVSPGIAIAVPTHIARRFVAGICAMTERRGAQRL
jgi:serine protease Do